jgi:protein-disulfide isomerase
MRRLLLLLGVMLASLGSAQIGEPIEHLLARIDTPFDQVADAYQSESGFRLSPQLRNGALYSFTAEASFDADHQRLATELIVQATGYADAEGALRQFFMDQLAELAGQGRVNLQLGIYLLGLTVTGDDAPYAAELELFIQEIPEDAFPEARHSLGPADARYVIREFSDFQCPFCVRFAQEALPMIKAELLSRGDVRFEYHHFPLRSIHPNAQAAAEAAECVTAANGPEDFWLYHDALFDTLPNWQGLSNPVPYFISLAAAQGLTTEGVRSCLNSGEFTGVVDAAFDAAVNLGLRGTPSVFVGGFKLEDYTQLEGYLELMGLVDAFYD